MIDKKHGKPFDYFRLGKSVKEGRSLLQYMKSKAEELHAKAEQTGAVTRVERCPVCASPQKTLLFHYLGFPYWQCQNPECQHVFVGDIIAEAIRNEFFASDSEYSIKNYCDPDKAMFRVKNISEPKVNYALQYAPENAHSWLDVGCGSGETVYVLQQQQWQAIGLELSRIDVEFGRAFFNIDLREQTLEAFSSENPDSQFDVVSFFGVLQCVPEPTPLVKTAVQHLKSGGLIVVEVPHYDAVVTSAIRSFPHHPTIASFNGITTLHSFTHQSIQKIFTDSGLEMQAVWYFGTDIFEILNQWSFSDEGFIGSPLYETLLTFANDFQQVIDSHERSSNTIWIGRKPA